MTQDVEVRVFERVWEWFQELRTQVHAQDKTLRGYCYNAGVEGGHLRRLGLLTGRGPEVDGFLDSDEWVDLLRVFDSQLITGGGAGLKVTAQLAGYVWPVDDPGGEESMMRYDAAVAADDEGKRESAREWLLAYNRGDVEATLALRQWLDREAGTIPSIEAVDPTLVARYLFDHHLLHHSHARASWAHWGHPTIAWSQLEGGGRPAKDDVGNHHLQYLDADLGCCCCRIHTRRHI